MAAKRHFCDPTLACALLKATPDRLIGDLETFGFLFEGMCERDLKIYAESFEAQLYNYQDYANREIDAVIELPNGNWCAFEIKLGANQIDKAAASLLEVRNSMLLFNSILNYPKKKNINQTRRAVGDFRRLFCAQNERTN